MLLTLLITTSITVFLAELGDKTQLATIAISSTTDKPLAVFIGSSTALIAASLLGVVAGGSFAVMIPETFLKIGAALGLVIIGVKLLWPEKVVVSDTSASQPNSQNQRLE